MGSDVNKENSEGEIPLLSACYRRNENLGNYLMKLGANINKLNNKNETP